MEQIEKEMKQAMHEKQFNIYKQLGIEIKDKAIYCQDCTKHNITQGICLKEIGLFEFKACKNLLNIDLTFDKELRITCAIYK